MWGRIWSAVNAHVDYGSHFPPEYEAGHTAGLRLLRVAARARAAVGAEAVGPLYAALGAWIFDSAPLPDDLDVSGLDVRGTRSFLTPVLAQAFGAICLTGNQAARGSGGRGRSGSLLDHSPGPESGTRRATPLRSTE